MTSLKDTLLEDALREAAFTTSRAWEYIPRRYGQVGDMFQAIGNVEVHTCGCSSSGHRDEEAIMIAAQCKAAARRAMDWMVNGETGFKSALRASGLYCNEPLFSVEQILEFTKNEGCSSTAFMLNRKQYRNIDREFLEQDESGRHPPKLFGRVLLINDWISWEHPEIWGLNLGPGGAHLWDGGIAVEGTTDQPTVRWQLALGYTRSDDVTCMRGF